MTLISVVDGFSFVDVIGDDVVNDASGVSATIVDSSVALISVVDGFSVEYVIGDEGVDDGH